MNSFFILLFLLCVPTIIVGIIKPGLLKLKSRKQVATLLGSSLVILIVLITITTEKKTADLSKTVEQNKTISAEDKIKSAVEKVTLAELSFGSIEKKEDSGVIVNINVKSIYTKDTFFDGIGKLGGEIYQAIFTENPNTQYVIIQYQGEKVDEFGKATTGNFVVQTLDKSTYSKIVWENFNTATLCDFLRRNSKNEMGEIVNTCSVFVTNLR